ncbi:MAG: D-alanine--D-alanine ligase family protein [Acidimicrobiia bacterium]
MKTRVVVLYGGRSAEREVSRVSAASILAALDRDRYEPVLVHIDSNGQWLVAEEPTSLDAGASSPFRTLPDVGVPAELVVSRPNALAEALGVDVVFPVLHGPYGEDGTIQGLLEMANVPYVGCGVLGSAVGMDKIMAKRAMIAAGLPVTGWIEHRAGRSMTALQDEVERQFGYPCFVKPANMGSSVGISRVTDASSFAAAVTEAERYDEWILVEEGLHCPREIEVGILGDEPPRASVPGEIRPGAEFYTYSDKYEADSAQLLVPAALDAFETAKVEALAIAAFTACRLNAIARVDCFLEEQRADGGPGRGWFVNEVNTMPGFTSISMYPKLWEATGVSYTELIDQLIALAFERFGRRNNLL